MKLLNLLVLIAVIASVTASAQEDVLHPRGKKNAYIESDSKRYAPFSLGIEVGANYNMFTQDHSWSPIYANPIWDAAKNADGFSPYVSVFGDLPLNDKWGLQAKVSLDWKHFKNNSSGTYYYIYGATTKDGDYTTEVDFLNVDLSLLVRYNFTKEFFITAGPIFLFNAGDLKNKWSQKIYWDQQHLEYSTVSIDTNVSFKSRVGLEAGLGYKFSLSKNLWLVPQVHFQWVPSLLVDDEKQYWDLYLHDFNNRKLNSLQIGLGLWFDFNN